MTDGHTESGKWVVKLELTKDMVDQLTRLLDMAKMMDGEDGKSNVLFTDEPFNTVAHRLFLQEILNILNKAIVEQQPFKEPFSKETDS